MDDSKVDLPRRSLLASALTLATAAALATRPRVTLAATPINIGYSPVASALPFFVAIAVFLADRILLLTRRPTRVASILPFAMARPRLPEATTHPDFVRVKAEALAIFRRETQA